MGKDVERKTDWLEEDGAVDAEIRYLAEHTDLSPNQARELVREHGTDRGKLMEIARTLKAEG
ncbi:hypothetical protein [Aquamicrobium sp. LC103]|uniref:hypothetical protein n=1 Tax=Aquamicrobium sp. LC103 TaxID=1120658 RepID=UPI00063E8B0F|nr:hypothetical protein [Aquamicrobium sp. LC103]TKT81289.1 hypothetical protein XW59_005345 [Aquamicrobium sp. LC103]